MLSAGNDIISLDLVDEQRSNNSRFYSKIITGSEKNIFQSSFTGGFTAFVWLCWSVKESAYKYLKRKNHELVFSPTKIIIRQMNAAAKSVNAIPIERNWEGFAAEATDYSGSVIIQDITIYFRSQIHSGLIATVVCEDENFEHTFWGIRSVDETTAVHQSKAVRAFFLNTLEKMYPGKDLHVEKNDAGYPQLFDGDDEMSLPVSFAHHGRFVSYSFSVEEMERG